MCIFVESFDVEVRIWSHEIEDIVLAAVCPVFPAFVPSLDKHLAEAVLCGEIDIAANFLVICRVHSVRLALRIVRLSEVYGSIVIGVGPCSLA